MVFRLIAAEDDNGRRLDRILRKALPELPLSALHRLIRRGKITVNGEKAALDERIYRGQRIEIADFSARESKISAKSEGDPLKNPLPLDILYEGSGLLVLNKPAGIAVHGPDSLEEQVRAYLAPKLPPSLSFRPGPLHRLDRPTSGLIVFSTNLGGAQFFSEMMRERHIRKQYLAVVDGVVKNGEVWEDGLVRDRRAGKTFLADSGKAEALVSSAKTAKTEQALTKTSVVAAARAHSLIIAEIETGKTHQIRSQAAGRGHPLSGDKKYGGSLFGAAGFLLHAWKLDFLDSPARPDTVSPLPGGFTAPPPDYFTRKIRQLFGDEVLARFSSVCDIMV